MSKIQSIRGMNDLMPMESSKWQIVESVVADVLARYGYNEIRFPIVEKTELFRHGIGEVTDIVEKEMYSFEDRNGDSLTLRPEGTAGCVRACIQNSLLDRAQRLWYSGPMFRHERPQKGRTRQFHQFGVEVFGISGPDIDAEIIAMTQRIWNELGVSNEVDLELNSLGTAESRTNHRESLVGFLNDNLDKLDEDSQRRLQTNPLRILDSKNPDIQSLVESAPTLSDYLDDESRDHFDQLQTLLDGMGIKYRVNPRLVRGLDYYNRTVFEWVTDSLGAQGTVCGGGRYDALVEQLGGNATPALGFGMGIERLVLLVETVLGKSLEPVPDTDVYIVHGDAETLPALQLAERLREDAPQLSITAHCGGGSFKSQFKKADRSGAFYAVVLGESEVANGRFTLKPLRSADEQLTTEYEELVKLLVND